MTAFAAAPAGATTAVTIPAIVAAQESPTPAPQPPGVESPTPAPQPPPAGEPATEPPTTRPEPPAQTPPQVPVTPRGAADTGSLDPAPAQGPGAGVVALGGMALLATGGLGIAVYRRRQHS